jgi:exosortase K
VRGFNPHKLIYLGFMGLLVYAIKRWYSHASVDDMQWMLRPLAGLLDVLLPGRFELQASGEWIHHDWKIILVKGCSGINFFLMSLIGYAMVFSGRAMLSPQPSSLKVCLQVVLALLAAWITTLLVNTLRILLAMSFVRHHALADWTGLDSESLHRLAGLLVYCPALFIQMRMSERLSATQSDLLAVAIVLFMLVIVPLLTGNAFADLQMFIRHCLWLLLSIGSCLLLALLRTRLCVSQVLKPVTKEKT